MIKSTMSRTTPTAITDFMFRYFIRVLGGFGGLKVINDFKES
jgi:hypothetical protein